MVVSTAMLTLAACSDSDEVITPVVPPVDPEVPEVPEVEDDTMIFTSTIKAPVSGSTQHWKSGDIIALSIEGVTKEYKAAADQLKSENPFEWNETVVKEVMGWHYADNKFHAQLDAVEIAADQSKGFDGLDFLFAQRSVSKKEPLSAQPLEFYHQTTQVEIRVSVSDDTKVESLKLGNNNINIKGTFQVPAKGHFGTWSEEQAGTIIPKSGDKKTFRAVSLPQNVEGRGLIYIKLENGQEFVYTPQGEEGELRPAERRVYNVEIEVEKNAMKVTTESTFDWISGGKEDIATSDRALRMTYTGKEVFIPELIGSDIYAFINWGDESAVEDYAQGLKHAYSSDAERTITIKHIGAKQVKINQMKGLKKVDLSKF